MITLTQIGSNWDAQGLGSVGYSDTAFGAIHDLEKQIMLQVCESFIANSKQIIDLPISVVK